MVKRIGLAAGLIVSSMVLFSPYADGAQSEPNWLEWEGVNGTVHCTTVWDPDGDGPLPAMLVAGGDFTIAGNVEANRIAAWDGMSWRSLGSEIMGVDALTVYNNHLIAGGMINIGGFWRIVWWDGSNWQPMGSSMDYTVKCVTKWDPDGNGPLPELLVAGGDFTAIGNVVVNHIALWNGTDWEPLGDGMDGSVYALTVNGDQLIAGGKFETAGSVTTRNIAAWDGVNWQPIGGGINSIVEALTVYNGQLIAGGGGWSCIAYLNGTTWQSLGGGMSGGYYGGPRVSALSVYDGHLVAAGSFTEAGGTNANCVASWDGTRWAALGSGVANGTALRSVNALTVYDGRLIAGGDFTTAGGQVSSHLARWGWAEHVTGDLGHDGGVGVDDLERFAAQWLGQDCESSGFCYEADLNYDRRVDFADFGVLALHWLE